MSATPNRSRIHFWNEAMRRVANESGRRRRPAQHLQRPRHGRPEGARQNGHDGPNREAPAGGRLRLSRLHGAGARRCAFRRACRISISSSARKNFIASPITWTSCWRRSARAGWMIRASRSPIRRKKPARRRQFANSSSHRGRRRRSFRSCRAATCIAPFASCRGRAGAERSRTIDEIVREVRELVARGVKEVTLARPNRESLRSPRISRGRTARARSCSCSKPCTRSTDWSGCVSPRRIRSDFATISIRALAELPKLAEHVHLPLQSGSDRILKAMHRPYTAEKY